MIYLDSAATSLIKPPTVERAVLGAMRSMASLGRGAHTPAIRAAETVYNCREAAAELFNVDDCTHVVFTMNATHALNIAIKSLAKRGSRVVVSGFEHNSVTRPLNELGADIRVAGTKLFDTDAVLSDFDEKIKGVDLVVCTHVSNVFGFVLPVYEIGELCRMRSVPFIVDASQSAGILDVDFQRLDTEFVAMPGHKALFGPQGTGILLCRCDAVPLLSGGTGSDSIMQAMPEYLPERLEAGTHNVCGIAGLKAGIDYIKKTGCKNIERHEKLLLKQMIRELQSVDSLRLFTGDCQSGVLSICCDKINCEDFAAELGRRGICTRAGLHCAPYAHRSAGTISSGTLRLSFSPFVTQAQVHTAAQNIKQIINKH
ncbi:MAG: aminotransferase class V-fold PLP-dependent enzyme [Oscillospiraceae bacterium]|nr:aminotransferase class V-fold PLP-dependent enzyme [Oscillospiraceae bacterium]